MEFGQANTPPDQAVRDFVSRLTVEQRLLVVLKRELYEGRWEGMQADLQARLEGRPYIFKLVNRITDDIQRIGELKAFEAAHGVDLADYVNLNTTPPAGRSG